MSPEFLTTVVQTFFNKLGVAVASISVTSGRRTVVAVTSPESEMLIGEHGDTLRAINSIVRRMVEHTQGVEAANFLVDINGYHEGQINKVRVEAQMLAQHARLFKRDIDMDPMSPYDRLVIHELFANDPEIETRSQGEGKLRHITLHYRDAAAATV